MQTLEMNIDYFNYLGPVSPQKETTPTMKEGPKLLTMLSTERKRIVQKQHLIKEAHSCLVKTIIQAAEKAISKTTSETKRRPTVKCKREERIVRAEYRKH